MDTEVTIVDNRDDEKEGIKDIGEKTNSRFGEKMTEALYLAQDISIFKEKSVALESIVKFLEEEQLEVPASYQEKAKDFYEKSEELLKELPRKLTDGVVDMKLTEVVEFIEEVEQNEREKQKLSKKGVMPLIDLVMSQLTEEQKETFHKVLHSEKISSTRTRKLVNDFERKIQYSFAFARKHILKDVSKKLTPFLDFIEREVPFYTDRVEQTLRWLEDDVMWLDLDDKDRIAYANSALRRFEIAKEDKEKFKQLSTEFAQLLKNL